MCHCWHRFWRRWYPYMIYPPSPPLYPPPLTPEEELAMLEDYKKVLEEDLKEIQEEIQSIEKRINELREYLRKQGRQP